MSSESTAAGLAFLRGVEPAMAVSSSAVSSAQKPGVRLDPWPKPWPEQGTPGGLEGATSL
jgi:hypothetical protein